VEEDFPVDGEATVITSSMLRFDLPTQFFDGAHRDKACMRS
jgi:hypothetical protein